MCGLAHIKQRESQKNIFTVQALISSSPFFLVEADYRRPRNTMRRALRDNWSDNHRQNSLPSRGTRFYKLPGDEIVNLADKGRIDPALVSEFGIIRMHDSDAV